MFYFYLHTVCNYIYINSVFVCMYYFLWLFIIYLQSTNCSCIVILLYTVFIYCSPCSLGGYSVVKSIYFPPLPASQKSEHYVMCDIFTILHSLLRKILYILTPFSLLCWNKSLFFPWYYYYQSLGLSCI